MSYEDYVAAEPPENPKDLPAYLGEEFRRVENAMRAVIHQHTVQFVDATADASAAGVIICDASATLVVINLPGVSSSYGLGYTVAKVNGANKVIIRSDGLINGVGSATLSAQYQQSYFLGTGKEWLRK